MGKFFDINDLKPKPFIDGDEKGLKFRDENSKSIRIKFDEIHERKVATIKMLTGHLPEENEVIFMQTTNSFNAFTFIVYLLKHAGRIEQLLIKTYSINTRILDSLSSKIRSNEIGDIALYIAESIKYRMPRVKDQLEMMVKEFPDFQVEYAWTHQKVICARVGTDHYVVEGSGNFSENSAEEQYIFMKSKRIYEFRSGYTK
jgi:hypothetical protein